MSKASIQLVSTILVITSWSLISVSRAKQEHASDSEFRDESAAHALYDKMIEAMRDANTLFYESDYRGGSTKQCKYKVWMKKPNYFRLEAIMPEKIISNNKTAKSKIDGILIGDGEYHWLYWPNGRPAYTATEETDGSITYSYSYVKSYLNTYLTGPTLVGQFSIGHTMVWLGCMGMPIINPSIFHGYTDSFQRHNLIDAVRSMGTEKIGDEECDVIEVIILKGQRCWYLWLSRSDHLPRKLKEVIRLANRNSITQEVWSKVTVNAEIPMDKFIWKPPKGWRERYIPGPEQRLLKAGQEAPNFDLLSVDGSRIKLSDYRGKVVWLTFWRIGCPPCLKEMSYLSKLYAKYRDKGLVVLGFNCADEKQRVLDVLRENSVTFPNIVDASSDARQTSSKDYGGTAVPLNYIIDRRGKVAAAWYGYKDGDERGLEVLQKLGIK